jgi:hypothetical protein
VFEESEITETVPTRPLGLFVTYTSLLLESKATPVGPKLGLTGIVSMTDFDVSSITATLSDSRMAT